MDTPTGDQDKTPPRIPGRLVGWIITIVVALLISTGTRAYAVQSYFVPTPSMTPTLMPGDRILVDKLSSTIHRGDIVVFGIRRPTAAVHPLW